MFVWDKGHTGECDSGIKFGERASHGCSDESRGLANLSCEVEKYDLSQMRWGEVGGCSQTDSPCSWNEDSWRLLQSPDPLRWTAFGASHTERVGHLGSLQRKSFSVVF